MSTGGEAAARLCDVWDALCSFCGAAGCGTEDTSAICQTCNCCNDDPKEMM